MHWQSSDPRPSFAGIALGSELIGVGGQGLAGEDRRCRLEIRQLIREMSLPNPLWGAPRIHGELLKLGIAIGQTSVHKYMARRRGPPSQGWRTFLRNHADGVAASRVGSRRGPGFDDADVSSIPPIIRRVDEDVAILIPHSPGCADFPLPVLHGRALLAKV